MTSPHSLQKWRPLLHQAPQTADRSADCGLAEECVLIYADQLTQTGELLPHLPNT